MNVYISDDKIRNNINYVRKVTGVSNNNMIAVLKDNAYGHGIQHIATLLSQEGISFFAVSCFEEALQIKEVNAMSRILLLKLININSLEYAIKNGFDLMVGDHQYLNKIIEVSKRIGIKPYIHIKVNEKLNRWGFSVTVDDISKIRKICGTEYPIEGIAVQFKSTYYYDINVDNNSAFYIMLVNMFEEYGIKANLLHYRTTSDLNRSIVDTEILRMGAGIYGIPNKQEGLLRFFEVAMRGESYIYATRVVDQGDTIGYKGHEFVVNQRMVVGLVADGKAHGIGKDSALYVLGKKVRILAIFMDVTVIQLESEKLVNEVVEIKIEDGEERSLAELTCDYGNNLLNKVIYE